MANATPTITFTDSRPKRLSPGVKMVRGTITFGNDSTFVACKIEKLFRRCDIIQVMASKSNGAAEVVYTKSGTRNRGIFTIYAVCAKSAIFCTFQPIAKDGLKGPFIAYGT